MRKIIGLSIVSFFILGITAIAFAMRCCQMVSKSTSKTAQAQSVEGGTEAKAEAEATEVGNKICPVSGEEIKEGEAYQVEHEGKIYNLCCKMCAKDFKKEPEKYIEKLKELEKKESREGHHEHEEHQH